MATIRINLSSGELAIEFTDTKDLEDQLEKIDLMKLDTLLNSKKQDLPSLSATKKEDLPDLNVAKKEDVQLHKNAEDPVSVNLLKVSEGKEDAVKLAVFLAASGMSHEEIKRITGVTILSS